MKKTAHVVIVILLPVLGFSQGEFLPKGQSGLGVSVGYALNRETTGIGLGAGFSINGIFDIGLDYAKASARQDDAHSVSTYSPFIAFHWLKQNENIKINLSLTANLLLNSYTDRYRVDYNSYDVSGNGLLFGVETFYKIQSDEKFSIMPLLGISYSSLTLSYKDQNGMPLLGDDGLERRDDLSRLNFSIALPLIFKLDMAKENNTLLIITPAVVVNKDANSFNISLSMIGSKLE